MKRRSRVFIGIFKDYMTIALEDYSYFTFNIRRGEIFIVAVSRSGTSGEHGNARILPKPSAIEEIEKVLPVSAIRQGRPERGTMAVGQKECVPMGRASWEFHVTCNEKKKNHFLSFANSLNRPLSADEIQGKYRNGRMAPNG